MCTCMHMLYFIEMLSFNKCMHNAIYVFICMFILNSCIYIHLFVNSTQVKNKSKNTYRGAPAPEALVVVMLPGELEISGS